MINNLFKYIYKYKNYYKLYKINKKVKLINYLEKDISKLNDKELSNKTNEFIFRLTNTKENIDNLLVEAFAVVKEAIKRLFGIKLFDVQLIGGIVLHEQSIAEMLTGEGKTLTATLSAYLNSLNKKGVHIVTMNDYLAKRDAENNRPLFEFLGLTVGINLNNISLEEKKKSYLCDITYGTNNEYCFDYLRDNMVFDIKDKVQRNLHYAILDEIDSILIDEARTPLIISSKDDNNYYDLYYKINSIVNLFFKDKKNNSFDYSKYLIIDYKLRQVNLTEEGYDLIEDIMFNLKFIKNKNSLYDNENIIFIKYIITSLKAHIFFKKNVDYIIKDNKLVIVDEHTGRIVEGRRWSDGLHQAIEAKENLKIQCETQNLTSITFQNYFRLYKKLSGMTGTAYTERKEFKYIYNLDTIVIPTNKPMIRKDLSDLVFLTEKEKLNAIIKDIISRNKNNQPILVGSISIEKSELLSEELKKIGISHKVLNAKFNDVEADIIAQAGEPGSITIATNMAGRGTDIILGGNWYSKIKALKEKNSIEIDKIKDIWIKNNSIVIKAGGMHVIGTERHESRRIDNQLKGRSGRQGDPGSSRFYLSMEDSLIKTFIPDNILNIIKNMGIKFGEPFEHPIINFSIKNAQKKIENINFNIRKQLVTYDDITNNQRKTFYKIRNSLLILEDLNYIIKNIKEYLIKEIIFNFINKKNYNNICTLDKLEKYLYNKISSKIEIKKFFLEENWSRKSINEIKNLLIEKILYDINYKESLMDEFTLCNFKKLIFIKKIDWYWKNHIYIMEDLYQGIHLRCYAQKDPKQEYKKEAFNLFENMLNSWKYESLFILNKFILFFYNNYKLNIKNKMDDLEKYFFKIMK